MLDPSVWTNPIHYLAGALLFGYLCGSIPFGLLITRFAGAGDVRKIGSGNIGATNVLRTGNKALAAATLLGDVLKGTVAVMVAGTFGPDVAIVAGLGAFLGHCFPVWLGFRGGKGVATYLGILIGMSLVIVPVFAITWLGTAYLTRYSSLSALIASIVTTIALFFAGQPHVSGLFALLTVILFYKHRENITRLLDGTESRIGAKG